MSPRHSLLILLVIVPVLAGRGGGGHSHGGHSHSGGYGHGHYSGSHSYPSSTGLSGNGFGHRSQATYPHSSTGLSGNNANVGNSHNTHTSHTYVKEVHHHHYSPPQQIHYGSGYHPVYQGTPPVYVYQYRDSGSRFDTLLTGLALYNLGRMSAHEHHHYDSNREYRGNPGEVCKMQIIKNNGEFEETRIDCKLMSSFIWEAEREQEINRNRVVNSNTITTTTINETKTGSNDSKVVTSTVQQTTVVDALNAKGPSIQVTEGMSCFMVRSGRDLSYLKKKIDCGLLQSYAVHSFSNAGRNDAVIATVIILNFFVYLKYFM